MDLLFEFPRDFPPLGEALIGIRKQSINLAADHRLHIGAHHGWSA